MKWYEIIILIISVFGTVIGVYLIWVWLGCPGIGEDP